MAVSVLLYGCNIWIKRLEKKLDGNNRRMLRTVLHTFHEQHLTKQKLYSRCLLISKTILTRHTGHRWVSKEKLISNVLLWTPIHKHTSVGWLAKTYIHLPSVDTGCRQEDRPEAINDVGKDNQKTPYYRHDFLLMMIMMLYIYIYNIEIER